jgi:hypothetical protein
MADLTVTALDPLSSDQVRYDVGADNWAPATEGGRGWVPDLGNGTNTIQLPESGRIDVLILGDGFEDESDFRSKLDSWIAAFFEVEVFERFRGAFRIRALFTRSDEPASADRDSFYAVAIDEDGDIPSSPKWWQDTDDEGERFRAALASSITVFDDINLVRYPGSLSDSPVIHNPLARLFSHLVVVMLVRRSKPNGSISTSPSGLTRRVELASPTAAGLNVAFGEYSLHEFGHAFAYLEDEYISQRGDEADRSNPSTPSVFSLSNLSFDTHLDHVPWLHLSPWGVTPRQAAGPEPSPVVGWLWRGGEDDELVWHSEYQCLMNGTHENYAYTPDAASDPTAAPPTSCTRFVDGGVTLRWRDPPTFCLWCQEIVVVRILEKTGQLATPNDDPSIDQRGEEWYQDWVTGGRSRYWETFAVADQIRERESWYADPSLRAGDLCQLQRADGSYLRLEASPLYQVFDAEPQAPTTAPAPDDGEELLTANA